MANKSTKSSDRCAETLFALLDSTARDLRMPESQRQATRLAVVTWLGQLDDKTVGDALRKLYVLAESKSRSRPKIPVGFGARMVHRLTRRFRSR